MPHSSSPLLVSSRISSAPLFRHYKGELYLTVGDCSIEATGTPGVLYKALDPEKAGVIWMRPALDFHQEVSLDLPRFAPVRRATDVGLRAHLPPRVISPEALGAVLSCYSEPWRFFHTPEHLFAAFDHALKKELKLSVEQSLALLFHDIVYVPGAPTGLNETQSGQLAKTFRSGVGVAVDWELIVRIVNETSSHVASCAQSAAVQALDLASLASAPFEFCTGAELAWLENRHLFTTEPRKEFDTGQLRLLLELGSREMIYPEGFSELEEPARANIEGLRQAWVRKHADPA
jgi:predicted metal-dependent HD superfamily phosphohydrolase